MSKPSKRQGQRDDARPDRNATASFDDVVALITERRKYVDWIAALEAKRDQTPEHVYTRVHADYEARLNAVGDKLAAHRGTLGEQQAALTKKLEELEERILHHQDERAETELRAHVGELSAAALTEALRTADTEIERLEGKRASVEADLNRVEEFFAAADGKGAIPSSARPGTQGGIDELIFLQTVVGPEAGKGERKS
jgi:chromosome segregation ATPase